MPEIPKTEILIISWDSNPTHPASLTKTGIGAAAVANVTAASTAEEFNALLKSLRDARILTTS